MDLEYKAGSAEFKAGAQDGDYEGYFSIVGNVDDGGDVIEGGAFTKTLQERVGKVRVFFGHDPNKIVGPPPTVLQEDSRGLYAKGRMTLDSFWGREAWVLLKDGALTEGSIGYRSIPGRTEWKGGHRHLQEVKLFEISFVPIGMNPETDIRALKSWTANGGGMGLYTTVLNRIVEGLNTVTGSDGQDIEAAREVRAAMWLAMTSLDKIIAQGAPDYGDMYLGLSEIGEFKGDIAACVKALAHLHDEAKAGRMLSGANEEKIRGACGLLQSAMGDLQSLIGEAAAAPVEEGKASDPAETASIDHSALQRQQMQMALAQRQLIMAGWNTRR